MLAVVAPIFGCVPSAINDDVAPSTSTSDAGTTCDPLEGTFAFEYTRRSGDCDDHEQVLRGLDQQLQFKSEDVRFTNGQAVSEQQCFLERVKMSETCAVKVERTCELRAPLSGTYTVTGQLSVLDDGSLEGALTFSVSSLGVTCKDVFDAEAERVD